MGKQGECSREQAKRAILLFAADKKKRKQSKFIEELVRKKHEFAKNTIYKYLDELVTDKLMKMEPGSREDSFRPTFSITKRGLEAARQIDVHDLVDSLGAKSFIGDVPCTLHKSVEGMQSHLAFRDSLYNRHARDLEGFREEFIRAHMKADKIGRARVEARIRDEVGWTIGEYLRKLLKKAEKQEGVRKIMTVLGITEQMLEEMDKQRVQQERVYKKALLRILEKHQLSVDKPIKDRELLNTILKEYDLWKKEYWKKQDVRVERNR